MAVHLTENQKHVRRRLEPLRMAPESTAVDLGSIAGTSSSSHRIRSSVVEAFGVRYRGGTLIDSGMDWTCGGRKPYLANRFVEEVARLSQLRHPHLAAFYGVATDALSLTVAIDIPADSLDDLIRRYDSIPESVKAAVLLDAARGLLYLHRQKPPVAHGRVSSRSVYVVPGMTSAKLGDVGVAGVLCGAGAAQPTASDGRMPPKALVDILEAGTTTGTSFADRLQADIQAFGNVMANTVCHEPWVEPPGHTGLSPHLHTMSARRHPLYSLAYHCLLGGVQLNPHQQVPRVDMDYVVQCLQLFASNNAPPFPNTLDLYHRLQETERPPPPTSQLTHTPNSPARETNKHHRQINGDIPASGSGQKICNDNASQPSVVSTSTSPSRSPINSFKSGSTTSSFSDTTYNTALPTPIEDISSRHNSTGQIKPPPPKPPQRTSSFRRKSGERAERTEPLQRAGSLRVKSQPPPDTQTHPQQANPVIKSTTGAMTSSTKQNPLLLPSKFSHEVKRGQQLPEQHSSESWPAVPLQVHTVSPAVTNTPDVSRGSNEFEALLARRREKVEAEDEGARSFSRLSPPSTSGQPLPTSHFIPDTVRAVTDMELPKKKAPPPPRRSSSFRTRRKCTDSSDNQSLTEVAWRQQRTTAPQWPAAEYHNHLKGGEQSPSSTSPSTGQSRPTSAEYQLRRLSGANLSETVFS